jgi:hypothetical protein
MARFQVLLAEKKDYAAAYALAKELAAGPFKDDAAALNGIAWTILEAPGLDKRDLDLAQSLATRANELSEGNDPSILDTLARACFDKGQIDKAVECQTMAVEKSTQPRMKRLLRQTLEKYIEATKAKTLNQ